MRDLIKKAEDERIDKFIFYIIGVITGIVFSLSLLHDGDIYKTLTIGLTTIFFCTVFFKLLILIWRKTNGPNDTHP